MSRADRRAYQRMTKNRDPYALPENAAVKARQARLEARRARAATTATGPRPSSSVSARFLWWTIGGALAAGLAGLTIAWPGMPGAALAGVGAALGWVALSVGLRVMGRRSATRR
ncbi:MAG TPA: hypothetical protein VJA85_08930 [Candidatus Limnocylindria bacterium]|nr:hypothetical protein [Candidatus Limnocylindria bacterium]